MHQACSEAQFRRGGLGPGTGGLFGGCGVGGFGLPTGRGTESGAWVDNTLVGRWSELPARTSASSALCTDCVWYGVCALPWAYR